MRDFNRVKAVNGSIATGTAIILTHKLLHPRRKGVYYSRGSRGIVLFYLEDGKIRISLDPQKGIEQTFLYVDLEEKDFELENK